MEILISERTTTVNGDDTMPEPNYRPLTNWERVVLAKLLSVDVPGIEVLKEQVVQARAITLDEYGSIGINVGARNSARFRDGPLVSATQSDRDTTEGYGPFINIILFVKSGLLNELQIYKDDSGEIINHIDPEKFDLVVDTRLLV